MTHIETLQAETLGTLTVTGSLPIMIDGLYMGDRKATLRFKLTPEGYERAGQLYKTFDADLLAQVAGFTEFRYSFALAREIA